jgi:hypothetical protein
MKARVVKPSRRGMTSCHPSSHEMVQHADGTEIDWFIVLDKHAAISLVLDAGTGKHSPDEGKALTNSPVIDLREY